MSKTPEELAEEFMVSVNIAKTETHFGSSRLAVYAAEMLNSHGNQRTRLKEGFIAGYQAAKNEDTCEHILDMSKMVDVNSLNNSNGWISVKDRLPTNRAYVLVSLRHSIEVLWYGDGRFTYDDGHELPVESCTHWMPLPKPPTE